MKILIGYDGSEHADAALDDLKRAGLPRDSEALVVSVADLSASRPAFADLSLLSSATGRINSFLAKEKRAFQVAAGSGLEATAQLQRRFPDWVVHYEVLQGKSADKMLWKADEWKPDLIVVGSQGRSAIGRLFLGSVSKRVVADARSSVRVARLRVEKDAGAAASRRIIVGVDGSPAAEQAIDAVGQRFWQTGTEVRLIAVDDVNPPVQIAARLPQAAEMINNYYQTRE